MKTLIASAVVVLLTGGAFMLWKNAPSVPQTLTQVTSTTTGATSGFATTTRTGNKLHYTNTFIGLSFDLPIGWHNTYDTLGNADLYNYGGYAQFVNFDERTAPQKSGYLPGFNKIEVALIPNIMVTATSSDYVEIARATTTVEISGRTSTKINTTILGGLKSRRYIIPMGSENSLTVSIGGDPKNFFVLDDLVKTLKLE